MTAQDSADSSPGSAESSLARGILATDLDGTLIPLEGNSRNVADLQRIANLRTTSGLPLVFVTGRHLASVREAMNAYALPEPDWIICDVGTTVCHRRTDGSFEPHPDYLSEMQMVITGRSRPQADPPPGVLTPARSDREETVSLLADITELRLQESEKQGPFKISYYTAAAHVHRVANHIAQVLSATSAEWSVLPSVDPFTGDGLIDVLPAGVSKAWALRWWARHTEVDPEHIVFAGDSGNDLAALTAGYRAIVVGNADRSVAEQARAAHEQAGWHGRLCLAEHPATSGVVEGCEFFGLF